MGTPVSSTNKTDRHDIAEILLKVALTKPENIFPRLLKLVFVTTLAELLQLFYILFGIRNALEH